MIPYGKHNICDRDIEFVIEVLKNEFLTQGNRGVQFENKVASYTGAGYAISVNSATAALHAGCVGLGVQPGDLVWTSSNSFVASANAPMYCGAEVDFVDIDLSTRNIDIESLKEKLHKADLTGRLPKVLIPVHFSGLSCDMKQIFQLSRKYGFKILEDASHAIGAEYLDKKVGCCEYSDAAVFSFHPVKIVTTGEGGILLTNSEKLANKARKFRTHGITRSIEELELSSPGNWYYEMQSLGFNYRLNDLAAALGISQLDRLDAFVEQRNVLTRYYNDRLSNLGLSPQIITTEARSSCHLYTILLPQNRDKIFSYMTENGIGVNVHYIPIHKQPYWKKRCQSSLELPNTDEYYSKCMTIPLYPDLNMNDLEKVVTTLEDAVITYVA